MIKIFEKFKKKYTNDPEKQEALQEIWKTSEEELIDIFADISDYFNVEIQFNFSIKIFKTERLLKAFSLKNTEMKKIYAYAAAGYTPCITVVINTAYADNRKVESMFLECLVHFRDYTIYKYGIGSSRSIFYLKSNDDAPVAYHRKSIKLIESFFGDFEDKGYEIIVSKMFSNNGKFDIKYSPGSAKYYVIKLYKNEDVGINLIDELYALKISFLKSIADISTLEDVYDVQYKFNMVRSNRSLTISGWKEQTSKIIPFFITTFFER